MSMADIEPIQANDAEVPMDAAVTDAESEFRNGRIDDDRRCRGRGDESIRKGDCRGLPFMRN